MRNPYVGTPVVGEQFVRLMRAINRIESTLSIAGYPAGPTDVMVVFDHSASMGDVLSTVKAQIMRVFEEVATATSGVHLGTVQMGVDGDTNDGTYIRKSRILDFPTWDAQHYKWVLDNQLPAALGSSEWFLNAVQLTARDTAWRSWVRKTMVIISDEPANQYRVGTVQDTSSSRVNETIQLLNNLGVSANLICPRASSWGACSQSFTELSSRTGGMTLVAPTDSEIINSLIKAIGSRPYTQTQWQRYEPLHISSPLGNSDGGYAVPSLTALDAFPPFVEYIRDMRLALERIAAHGELKAPSGNPYSFSGSVAENPLAVALGDGSSYGTNSGRTSWRRAPAQMVGTSHFDIDIGEIREVVRVFADAAGLGALV